MKKSQYHISYVIQSSNFDNSIIEIENKKLEGLTGEKLLNEIVSISKQEIISNTTLPWTFSENEITILSITNLDTL